MQVMASGGKNCKEAMKMSPEILHKLKLEYKIGACQVVNRRKKPGLLGREDSLDKATF